MTKENKHKTEIFLNGFECRRHNKKIACLQVDDGSHYLLMFAYARREKLSDEQKKRFDTVIERMGITYTEKVIGIFNESFETIMEGFVGFAIHHRQEHFKIQK